VYFLLKCIIDFNVFFWGGGNFELYALSLLLQTVHVFAVRIGQNNQVMNIRFGRKEENELFAIKGGF